MKAWRATAFMVALTGCGQAQSGNNASPAPAPSYKSIGEYKGIKLGSSFEDVIGTVDADLFNPYGLKECFRDLALRGCGLSRKSDDTMFDMREGVPYALKLDFNRKDKLAEIGLNYHREGSITGQQCRNILATTIDWIVKDYGPITYLRPGDEPHVKLEADNVIAKTPGGTTYAYLKPEANGSYVTQFLHLASEKIERKMVEGKRQVLTTKRGISLFSSYIVVDRKPICDVDLQLREPDSVERSVIVTDDLP